MNDDVQIKFKNSSDNGIRRSRHDIGGLLREKQYLFAANRQDSCNNPLAWLSKVRAFIPPTYF